MAEVRQDNAYVDNICHTRQWRGIVCVASSKIDETTYVVLISKGMGLDDQDLG